MCSSDFLGAHLVFAAGFVRKGIASPSTFNGLQFTQYQVAAITALQITGPSSISTVASQLFVAGAQQGPVSNLCVLSSLTSSVPCFLFAVVDAMQLLSPK